jgi:hypothetical protein
VQYQSLEAKKLWKEFTTEDKKNGLEGHGCSLEIDESEFFNAYENLPEYREEFFDCLEKRESESYDDCARRKAQSFGSRRSLSCSRRSVLMWYINITAFYECPH